MYVRTRSASYTAQTRTEALVYDRGGSNRGEYARWHAMEDTTKLLRVLLQTIGVCGYP